MLLRSLVAFSLLASLHDGPGGGPHDGPDPIGSWRLCEGQVKNGKLVSLLGVDGRIEGKAQFVVGKQGGGMLFDGKTNCIVLADDFAKAQQKLPKKHMTATAWVAVNKPVQWGGVLGCVQDNGKAEAGWVLGYDQHHFTFGLASKGADDGDGQMTYLAGKTRYEVGRYYHVCGTYDGKVQRLYVNGKLDGESKVQSGSLLYAESAPLVIGAYRDRDENTLHHGRIYSVRIFDETAKPAAAIEHYRAALGEDSDRLRTLIVLAKVYSSHPDNAVRDGQQALDLATRACELTSNSHPDALDALAAAHAENGDFEAAVSEARKAVAAARKRGAGPVAAAISRRLRLYEAGKPFRQGGGPRPK